MSFRINSSVASITAQRHLAKNARQVEHSLAALASGQRVVRAGDDAAGFAIAESLRGQAVGLKQAKFNAENAVSLIQTAEGGLSEQNNILVRMRELAVLSASDTVGENEREFIDREFQQLIQEFDRLAQSTRFGSKRLLTGTGEKFAFQVGPYPGEENVVEFALEEDTSASNVGIDGLNIEDQDDARDSLSTVDEAIQQVASARASFGAYQSRFQYAVDNLSVQRENIEAARSRIADVDVAEEVSELAKARILQDISTAVLTQAHQDSERAIRLIAGI